MPPPSQARARRPTAPPPARLQGAEAIGRWLGRSARPVQSSHSNFLSALRPSSPPSADHGLACGLRTVLGLLRGAPPSRAESSRPCRTPIAYNPRPSGRDTPPWTPRARGAPAWAHGRRRVSRKTEGRGPSASRQTFRQGRTGLMPRGRGCPRPCAREREKNRACLEESNNEYWARTAALASAQHQNSRCNGEPLQRRSLPPPSLKPGALKCGTGRA